MKKGHAKGAARSKIAVAMRKAHEASEGKRGEAREGKHSEAKEHRKRRKY